MAKTKKAPKRKRKKAAARPKRKRVSKGKPPALAVARGMAVAGKGWVWSGRLGVQPLGHVLARSKSQALRRLRTIAARIVRGGR